LCSPVVSAGPFEEWSPGQEVEITGHSFEEEYWTADVTNTTPNGDEVTFTVSYVNAGEAQAFLMALKTIKDQNNGTGTLPWQVFGLHYFTPEGNEVFLGATLAFLATFTDNNGNGIPDKVPTGDKALDWNGNDTIQGGIGQANITDGQNLTLFAAADNVAFWDKDADGAWTDGDGLFIDANDNDTLDPEEEKWTLRGNVPVNQTANVSGAETHAWLRYFDANGNGTYEMGEVITLDNDEDGIYAPSGETIYYVVPFGAARELGLSSDYQPEVESIPAEKLGEGHYQFGMTYKNLYAFVSPNPFASLIWRTGYIARFSELTITYDINIDNETGEITTETWYTIGQVTELWLFFLGIPIPLDPGDIPATMGLGVVHYVSMFTSKYTLQNEAGNTVTAGIDRPAENLTVAVGDATERAFEIGFRGDFDLIDETTDTTISTDTPAINLLMEAKAEALLLVGWQLGFSAAVFSVFAYGLSEEMQGTYNSPKELAQNSLRPNNPQGFGVQAFWYAVFFPNWEGYRIVHDPGYTAYTNIHMVEAAAPTPVVPQQAGNPAICGLFALVGIIAIVAVVVLVMRGRRKNAAPAPYQQYPPQPYPQQPPQQPPPYQPPPPPA